MTAGLDTVTAMIAPALFMTATGSLLISTTNRMSRIVDRIRVLVELDDHATRHPNALDFPELRKEHTTTQLRHLQWRSNRMRVAVTNLYLAMATFAATSMIIGLDSISGHLYTAVAVVLAIVGVGFLLVACANLVLEARRALRSNELEIRYHQELIARRRAASDKPIPTSTSRGK